MVKPEKIWSSSQLPTLPTVAVELLDLSRNPATEIGDVVNVIRRDPAICAKLLKATNSSFFGFRQSVTTIDRAVLLLGSTVVTSLSLSFSLSESAMTKGPMQSHFRNYWLQSVVQALAGEVLATQTQQGLACEYFLLGLMLDLGRVAMLKAIPNDYLPALEVAAEEKLCLAEVEREMLGFDHVQIGTKLMEHWQLPEFLIEATQYQHRPLEEVLSDPHVLAAPLIRAAILQAAVGEYYCATNKGPSLERLGKLAEAWYQFSNKDLQQFLKAVKERVEASGDLFSVNADDLDDPSDLMALANEHLANLAMREHVASAQAVARQEAIEREKKALENQNQELQKQVLRDALTKVYNRHFLVEAMDKELSRCRRGAYPIGVIFIDIDHFKKLNDTYGHQFGDVVLVKVAQTLQGLLRSSDVLARYGGEEFVILVVQPTEKGMEKVCERLREGIEKLQVEHDGKRVPVTISVGGCITIPERNCQDLAARLMATADEAMYVSKQTGRNRWTLKALLTESQRRIEQLVSQYRFSRWLAARKAIDIPTLTRVLVQLSPTRLRIGDIAQTRNMLSEEQVYQILQDQDQTEERFGEIAIRLGFLNENQVVFLLAIQQEDPMVLARTLIQNQVLPSHQVSDLLDQFRGTLPGPSPRERATASA